MESMLGMKELYSVSLKATFPMKVGDREIEEGEVIAHFDEITISTTNEVVERKEASGGFDNRGLVHWDNTREVTFNFAQGVFSQTQFALLSNSKLINIGKGDTILVPLTGIEKESDEEGMIMLKEIPKGKIFVYNQQTGDKLDFTLIGEKKIQIAAPFTDVVINYSFEYNNGANVVKIGQRLLAGYVELEGKTRLKDDTTGHVVTGIIRIPKLKLMSDLSMRLGKQANPMVANFSAIGYPTGGKGNKTVMDIVLLNDDIDSDI